MKQLIDTHTLLWFTMGNPRISDNLRLQIENNDNLLSTPRIYCQVASVPFVLFGETWI